MKRKERKALKEAGKLAKQIDQLQALIKEVNGMLPEALKARDAMKLQGIEVGGDTNLEKYQKYLASMEAYLTAEKNRLKVIVDQAQESKRDHD